MPYIIETGELLRFTQEAKERVRYFYTEITLKKIKIKRKHNQVNFKIKLYIEILNNAEHQIFKANDVLQKNVTEINQKLEANKKQLSELTTEVEKVQEIERLMDQKPRKFLNKVLLY